LDHLESELLDLTARREEEDLDFEQRLELEDKILEIKLQLGKIKRNDNDTIECIGCSA